MPRFGLDESKLGLKYDFSQTENENSLGQETGDASFCNPNEKFLVNDETKRASKQKWDFCHHMNSKKKHVSATESRDMPELTNTQPWDYKPDIKCILERDKEDEDSWLDDCRLSVGSDGDNFKKVFNAKSPSAEKAATLLDELVKLRSELCDRIKELAKFKQDVREVGKLIREDPWEKVQRLSAVSSQQSAARMDKMLDSVELTTNKIESVCGELDQDSSHTYRPTLSCTVQDKTECM